MPNISSNTIQFHVAAYSVQDNEYKFLIIQRASHILIYPNVWQVITGTINENESALHCALREVSEEIGIDVSKFKLYTLPYITKFFIPKRDCISLAPVFAAIINLDCEIILSDEHQDYKWVSDAEFDNIIPLPSHKDANKIFIESVLNSTNPSLFELNL